jgi:dynactin 1
LQLSQLAEGRVLDAQEQLEMAMLDKEVAEEKAELAQTELAEVQERLAVVEVELGVLKESGGKDIGSRRPFCCMLTICLNVGGSGGDAKGKDSLAYIQLEKQNERLKEALIRFV